MIYSQLTKRNQLESWGIENLSSPYYFTRMINYVNKGTFRKGKPAIFTFYLNNLSALLFPSIPRWPEIQKNCIDFPDW